jgi:hypothetical protein
MTGWPHLGHGEISSSFIRRHWVVRVHSLTERVKAAGAAIGALQADLVDIRRGIIRVRESQLEKAISHQREKARQGDNEQ